MASSTPPSSTLKQINTGDKNSQLIQSNISTALTPSQNSPFVGGVLLTGITLQTGSNPVQHTLGRTPKLWVICDISADQSIYRTSWDTSVINLTCSGAATIAIWVN